MWRVGLNLASGQAHESGELETSVEIDSLNVGVRTRDDLLKSIEHEAAHVTRPALPRDEGGEAEVDRRVKACHA